MMQPQERTAISAFVQDSWRPATLSREAASFQPQPQPHLPSFQVAGFMMTRIPGTENMVPAIVLSAPQTLQPTSVSRVECPEAKTAHTKVRAERQKVNVATAPKGLTQQELDQQALETFSGELPSVGSDGHFDGLCKRCAFFPKGRCTNGKDCTHCHFAHAPRSRPRKRCAAIIHNGEVAEDSGVKHFQKVPEREAIDDVDLSEGLLCLSEPDTASNTSMASIGSAIRKNSEECDSEFERYPDLSTAKAILSNESTDADTTPSVSALSENGETLEGASDTCQSDQEIVSDQAHDTDAQPPALSWSAARRNRKADVGSMARSLLNKLTEQRFESLCSQMLSLPLSTPEDLAVVVSEIFQKATTENAFRTLYTELCIRLDDYLDAETSQIGGKQFRRALINECQITFERDLKTLDNSVFAGLSADECFEVEVKVKARRLGNMRFIGDLLLRRLLAIKLLPPILHQLLVGDEAALESLIALLLIVAPEFETKTSPYQATLKNAFTQLRQKMTNKSVSPRLSCLINDLLDARERGWVDRPVSA